jgi:hypothetical protein
VVEYLRVFHHVGFFRFWWPGTTRWTSPVQLWRNKSPQRQALFEQPTHPIDSLSRYGTTRRSAFGGITYVDRPLAAALWGWCKRTAGDASIYQYLDNQPLADLLAGRFPSREPLAQGTDRPQVSFSVGDEPARDREGILESLRRALPSEGVADVRVDGLSRRPAEMKERTS